MMNIIKKKTFLFSIISIVMVPIVLNSQDAQPLPTRRRLNQQPSRYTSPYAPYFPPSDSYRYMGADPSRYNYYAPYANYYHYYDNPPGTYYYNYPYGGYYNYRFARFGNYYRR